jgi:hypothetical protein
MWIPTFRGKEAPKKERDVFPETLTINYMTTWYPEPDNQNMNLVCHEHLISGVCVTYLQ